MPHYHFSGIDVFLKVAAGFVGCISMVAAVIGARDVVAGLQAGSTMTLGGLVELGVATACTVVVILAAWHVFTYGRRGLQQIGALIDTVPGQAAAGVLLVAVAIGGGAPLIREGRWL